MLRWSKTLSGVAVAAALLTGTLAVTAAGPAPAAASAPVTPPAGPVARLLAKDANQSLSAVLALKQQDHTWKAVIAALKLDPTTVQGQLAAMRRGRARAAATVAVLAKLSGKTAAEVHALKKKGVTWSQVATEVGVNWQTALPQIQAQVKSRSAGRIRSAAVTGLLAQLSGKTPAQVRALKKKGVTWLDVAHSLGIQ
jgi:hypothetical protein